MTRLLPALLLLLSLPAVALDALYFAAKPGPAGSLTRAGQGEPVVYLRWDTLESELPADIARFELERDGQPLRDGGFPARDVMSATQIQALYAGPAQQRRMLETVAALKRQALADPDFGDFALNDFGRKVRQRLLDDDDALWRYFAARADFNIARARYRAFLDAPGAGVFDYELLAVSASGERARVGFAQVDTTRPVAPLPPREFRQVFQGACDSPDAGKDDYTVALSWLPPAGQGLADALASQLFVAGYDLYRTRDNLDPATPRPAPRNLAAEARGLQHDAQGRVAYPGLEKVNEVLLTVDGGTSGNGEEPVFLETHNELAAAGLLPGDVRAYYLVPRDFAGHYGQTLAAIVRVPDRSRPPPPWDVRVYNDLAVDPPLTELIWEAVEREHYLEAFGSGIRICNAGERSAERYLSVVGQDEQCAQAVQRRIRMPAADYLLYRFDNANDANAFKDSDGDGVRDRDERPFNMQCDPSVAPANAPNYRVPLGGPVQLGERVLRPDHGRVVTFRDLVPGGDQGTVYWYRVVSRAADQRLSVPSAPVRVVFPERELPPPPQTSAEVVIDGSCTACRAVTRNPDGRWDLVDETGRADNLAVSCPSGATLALPFAALESRDGLVCQQLRENCGAGELRLGILDASVRPAALLCETVVPADIGFCDSGTLALEPAQCQTRPIAAGERSDGDILVTLDSEDPARCVTLTRTDATTGSEQVVESTCGGELNVDRLTVTLAEQEQPACLRGYSQDSDGNVSPAAVIGCLGTPRGESDSRPAAPQAVALEIDTKRATLQWRLPVEPVAVTLIELRRQADGKTRLASVPRTQPAAQAAVETHALNVSDVMLAAPGELWCARFRTLPPGDDAPQSDWSPPLCANRAAELPPPDYLPWPELATAPQLADVSFQLGSDFVGRASPNSGLPMWPITQFVLPAKDVCGPLNPQAVSADTPGLYLKPYCTPTAPKLMGLALGASGDFAVFRRSRDPAGVESDYIQVSPLLRGPYWAPREAFDQPDGGGDPVASPYTRALDDPWLQLYQAGGADDFGIAFVDRYPVLQGHEYRYQIVHFSRDNRITGWRHSNWLRVGGGS